MALPATDVFSTTWLGDDDVAVVVQRWGRRRELFVTFSDGSYLVVQSGGGGRRSTARSALRQVQQRVERRAGRRTTIRMGARRG